MNSSKFLHAAAAVWLLTAAARGAPSVYDIRDSGAKGDGQTLCTQAIQKTIDQCAAGGGGTVYFPPGTWLSGAIHLKSHVTLQLDSGCTLLGSPRIEDYPDSVPPVRSYTDNYVRQSLISGHDLEDVAIRGRGTIDGQGAQFRWPQYKNRPYVIRLAKCRDVLLEGIRLQSAPMWMQHYLACDRVTLRGLTVINHVSYNNDGIDLDGCRDVSVADCNVDSDDDALCLKSTLDRPCENVRISNCTLSSHCNALKMGTESNGGFRNIAITNCTIRSPGDSQVFFGSPRGLAGLALEIVDGGHMDRVSISNITMEGVTVPIFVRLGNRARPFRPDAPKPGIGTLRNVVISHVVATGASKIGCSITGLPGHPVEGILLSDIRLSFDGGGTPQETRGQIPEKETAYPESKMFGILPAYGFYFRHVKDVKLTNVQLQTAAADARHAIVCDDGQDVVIEGLDVRPSPGAAPVIRLVQTQGALLRGCRLQTAASAFVRLEGDRTQRVVLSGNDLGQVGKTAEAADDVPRGAIAERP